ncbi:ATP-dependent zinc metalloprotease FtsH [uncultured Tyzzerella sp.]|uniref:ATP-dependent zinc metalloprotease FtsH n=1 Tax=uncultured Tyzzerella sp. TaxID=2321398 RepID=UPI0029424F67|nr:ATP-dependent zinc metalloprotease FtsH [uncultured Tyzzerella sp.]
MFKTFLMYILIFIFIFLSFTMYKNINLHENKKFSNYTYSSLVKDIKENQTTDIKSISIKTSEEISDKGSAVIYFNDGYKKVISIPSISSFMDVVHSSTNGTNLIETYQPTKPSLFSPTYLPIIIVIITIIIILFVVTQQTKNSGGGGRVMSFGKSKAKILTDNQKTASFKDVAGLKEEKYDLEEVVDFLKDPKKYKDIGARIPKGILLVGPPGTGKTLLARAIAGEAGVQFFSISGSDFVEMFVGVGASRVRDMFEEAKKNKPCLIFIDEIDAVGRRRGSGLGGGHDEREQTLNQLLVEMDGFSSNENIIIIAATNRVDILDPALLRPGRFDRQIYVGAPDVKGREEILKVHAKTKKLDENVNLEEVAKTTSGFTGAQLENLLNEAAIIAAKKGKQLISIEDVRKAFIKVGVGTEKKSRIISQEEREITAYHEAGHAIITEMLPLMDAVHIISIIPTGGAGGYTMHLPVDKGYFSKNYLKQEIMVLFGGRIAEEIIFDDITTGASSDIERASKIARGMVTKYGMSSLGPIEFIDDEISPSLASSIDTEIKDIVSNCYDKAKEILKNNIEYLHSTANLLLEKEKITGDEFRALFPENFFPEKKLPTYPEKIEDKSFNEDISNNSDISKDE